MRKFLSLLVALATVTMAWAAQGGTLTSSKTPIDPTQTVTLTYDGTGTNFANWEPSCFIHTWLVAADGQTLSKSYSTDWASCNGDGDYASLASKLKMTYSGTKGKYTISMNIKEFFNVADADLPKIGKLGVIVRAQYDGDANKTNDMFVNVAYTAPASKVTYTALTKAPTTGNWAGQYLIVWADNKAHATVSGKDLAATSDVLTITDGEIEINSTDKYYVTVELMQGGYSIKLPSGKYLSVNANDNKVAEVNNAYAFNFEYTASGVKIFGKDTQGNVRYVFNNGTYYRSYKWNDSYKLPTLYRTGDEAPALQTLFFVNTLDWAKVNAFVWPATGDAYKEWPGEAAVKTGEKALEKDIYSYTFPATFVNAIFNNGTAQTADLKWDKAKPYFVPGDADGEGKFTGTWYASKDDIPVPGKYYITGDSALVVDAGLAADKAWTPAAIKADADTTVLNLKQDVDYKLKVTVDGTWATALGYDALSEKAEGLIADADGNICFKLAEAGAVQVVYFKKGDVVTFKVLGKFYIKPVIVETLNLVPNMWSEAGAKMAAWVWGDDLAGAWTPFFAGEGDTLSVKINAEADSIIFVRMNSDATEPDWSKEWNRVKDEEIDHVGLTYTITAWGDEGVSVGQWTPYEPVVPGKYYITGDSALVVDAGLAADKAWTPAAIKADADTTVLNLKAGVDYKLKVTVDGTWATALGYDALSEKAEGLIADADGNICFKLAEAGAVQVVYFKKGDVVTFKVLGKFYIKPVIVETLKLVPNMWSEAGAKMAAWVWGEGLAGAWTPFFAGEGDTLSVKINAEADSIIFVRMNSDATEPDWSKEWNRVKDEEIDHVGLTYTITAWGDEGVSVGQWTPYEPVVPGKYYITGDSALVVDAGLTADKAWTPAAIKADADTTVLNLKAGVEYKLKVTVDGTWATALGYDALSEKAEGLIADADGNICFKLAEAGAVQVVYFKKGDVVTFKVLGNFYIKPVIVETLKLVPNMWSEAGAKMAAWVWGEGLAGAWTPFFAGEGDTLSVKIDEQADSVVFVRFASDVTAPAWDATLWNRVKDEEIDHVGLTYTITAWGDEGVSIGQWTPYEPAGGCDWDNLPWLGSALPAYAEQFKICLGDPKPGVVNIQESFGTEAGIYVNFPSAAFGPISLSEGQYAIQGAGMLLYVSAFTAKETEVSVVCENVEYVFTVYNDKGGDPICKDKYGLKVGETVVEFAKNEAQTEWVEYYKQGVELTAGDVIVLYNICEDQTFAAKVAGYEGLTPLVGSDGWTVTETAKYDFYLKLIYGADELYVDKQGDTPVEGKYFITGDSALVVDAGLAADKAWTPAAIKADADTTILNLKANVDYKLKITLDGTWNTALGYDALSEKAEGLIKDADGNICFKLAEAGAVQVIYFKAGDVVTFKVLGNFYIKPVIVETLNLVPNMWSEAGAKMAAWVWGEGLAGAWTPFFAGEGDTLSVKINAEADSIIFVRFASDVTAPAWDATLWNRVKDEEIDHVGLTYTITAWGDEGVSVGQWTPYKPAGGCDWDNLPWLGSALPAYAEQFKVCVGDPKPTEVVNIQKPGFATEIGIYITFPSAAFTSFSLPESAYDIQGAGVIFHLSAFTARETEVTVVCESKDYIFTVFNKKGGEPEKVYTIVGEAALVGVEWNPEATQNDMAKQADGSYKLVKENVALEAKGYEYKVIEGHAWGGWELPTSGANQTIIITAAGTYNVTFTLSADLATLTAEATPVGPAPEKVYTIVGEAALVGVEWNPEATDNDMAKQADGSYKLVKENVVLEAKGYDYKVIEGHAWGGWELPTGGANQTITITAAGTYNVTFTLSADLATLTAEATPVGPAPEKVYTIVGVAALVGVEWNPEATQNDMAKQADGSYKLVKENVALASGAYEYKVVEGHVWTGWQIPAEGNQSLTIDAAGVYNVTFTLDAALTTLTVTATNVGPMPEQEYGLMIDGTTFIKAQPNPATANEYMVLDVALTAGQTLQIYDKTHEVGWAIDKWNEGSYKFEIKDNKYIVSETAKYDFYVNLEYGNDYIYVAKKEGPSAIENLVAPANELRKVMIDGKLYILRDGKVYSVQGQLIR